MPALRHVLVTAAHSDDCVIVGAEYAHAARRAGKSVGVAYLTCSGTDPSSGMAMRRRREAVDAWHTLGVDADSLCFIDLPESPVQGPRRQSGAALEGARDLMLARIAGLPADAAIIVPAGGETHVDHRTLRALVIDALGRSGRPDIVTYEVPEYNALLTLSHTPGRVMRAVLLRVPVFGRLAGAQGGSHGFGGGEGWMQFSDADALGTKLTMLRAFVSQNPDLLVRAFGGPTRYREFDPRDPRSLREFPLRWSFLGHWCSSPVLLWASLAWLALLSGSLLTGLAVACIAPSPDFALGYVAACAGMFALYAVRAARRRHTLPQAASAFAIALGGCASLLAC